MNVSLTPELEALVDEQVESGMYHTASEVIREALRLFKERDEYQKRKLEALVRDINVGLKQLDAGKSVPLDRKTLEGIKTRGRARLAAERKGRK